MAVLYSNLGARNGTSSGNGFVITVTPPAGTTAAVVTSVTVMFVCFGTLPYGPGTLRCTVKLEAGGSATVSQSDFVFDTDEEVVIFSFDSVVAEVNSLNQMTLNVGTPGDFPWPFYVLYKGLVDSELYVQIEGEWVGNFPPNKPTNPTPTHLATGQRLNLASFSWEAG